MNRPAKLFLFASFAMLGAISGQAQSIYSNAVMALGPVGYWPMHENEAMTHGDIETNYGSAGPQANGYYGDWSAPGTIQHGYVPGVIAGDTDPCMYFNYFFSSTGNKGSTTNCLIVPHTSPAATLVPPFSVEVWYEPTNNLNSGRQNDIWSTVNAGGSEAGLNGISSYSGIRLYYNNFLEIYSYNNNGGINSANSLQAVSFGQWHHIVVTDDGSYIDIYLDGSLVLSNWPNAYYAPNYWDPIEVDTGKGYTRDATGLMQDFAVYTNALSALDISNHYAAGITVSSPSYETLVFNDHPTILYRFDSPSYAKPAFASLPALANYGSSGVNGAYTAGTLPAGVGGPNNGNSFAQGFGSWTNAMPGSGMSSFADAGASASYNPTGASANFSIAAWFQGDPCDSRVQTIVGHGIGSWGITMNGSGQIVFDAGTNNASEGSGSLSSDLVSPTEYNDGFWHYVVATHSGTANVLYLDGAAVANNNSPASIPGSITNVMIGADASFTNTSGTVLALGRQFEGNVCEVSMFGSALTASQVTNLYNAGEMPPFISVQPVSSLANQNSAFTNTLVARGAAILEYQWYTNGVALAGQTNASLILNPVLSNYSATNYYCIVTNNYGSATSAVVSLTVNGTPALIGQYPVTYSNILSVNYLTLYAGANPTFSVAASGATPLSYFWYTNGVLDGAATTANLQYTNVQAGALITNFCVVSNSLGIVTSFTWNPSVIADPIDNNLSGSPPSPYPTNLLSLKPIGYWRLNESEVGGGDIGVIAHDYAGGNDAIYTNVLLGQAPYNYSTDPSDTSVQVDSDATPGTHSYASQIGTNVDFAVPTGGNGEFTVETWAKFNSVSTATFPQGSGIVCKGVANGGEEFALETSSSASLRFFVRNAAGTQFAADSGISPALGVWYHLVGVCDEINGRVLLYVNGQLAATNSILVGSGIFNASAVNMTIASRSMIPGAISEQMDGYLNDVAVFNYALSSNQVVNEYYASGIPPYFTLQPASTTYVGSGSNVTLTAAANGTPSLAYQWYETNLTAMTGSLLANQTNATLVISNDAASDNYFLTVSNAYGTTNSVIATASVYSSPLIIGSLPVPYTNVFTLYAGATPSFSVSALGFGALSYYWSSNGVPVAGVSGSNLTLSSVSVGLITNSCIASNFLGTATISWTASVIAVPSAPYPQAVMALKPIGYWRMNDTNLDGVDNGNGDNGYVCHDYAGGNDGIFTNLTLSSPGYNPVADPSDSSAQLGFLDQNNDFGDSLAHGIEGINFGATNTGVDFTAEVWVQGYPQTSDAGIITLGYSGAEQFDLDTGSSSTAVTHGFRFLIRDAGGSTHAVNSATNASSVALTEGSWHHLVGVVDEITNHNMVFYIDGVPVGTASVGAKAGILASAYPLGIGSRLGSATTNYNFQFVGNINDAAIFNYPLSPSQVANEFDAGGGTIAPYLSPVPSTNSSAAGGSTLSVPVTAIGTPPLGYWWTNLTTSAAISSGTAVNGGANVALSYPSIPLSWNGNELSLTVSNAYGMTNAVVFLTITNGVNQNPTNIVFAVTNNQLSLSWPADHTGWQLQAQTNNVSVGINTNWANVSGSTTTNRVFIPINLTNGCVFYRLIYP